MVNLSGSWRTTVAGVFLALGLILPELGKLLDNDPATNPDWSQILGGLTAGGGALGLGAYARDNKVSSEEAGAKPAA